MKSPVLQPGDIVGVKNSRWNPIAWISEYCTYPHSPYYHFLMVGYWRGNNWTIYESIGKGVAIGFLDFYKGKEVIVYRIFATEEFDAEWIGRQVTDRMPRYGRGSYDYLLPVKLIAGALKVWSCQLLHLHLPTALRPASLPYTKDSRYICTELAVQPFADIGHAIVPPGVVPIPASIKEAQLRGRVTIVWEGQL